MGGKMIIIFCGIPACGKSTVAEKLVRKLNDLGASYKLLVSDKVSNRVYEKIFRFLRNNIEEARYLIVDATFYKKKWRSEVQRIARENDEELFTVYLHCDLEASLRRNEQREKEERVSEKAIRIIQKEIEKPENPDLEFNTAQTGLEKIVKKISKELQLTRS
ncbi:hypothetical protein AKJ65_02010 [candidate division MSBL1 archaeon SCGC-AAA259E19]|uniref:Adenylyl-sulfate kinase n=2 Tax=candidate division MSBL1 TaxID=215777 RepID=A0A133UXW7_9EURY|nr:hypothetical protein AKJ65_02010 [candidate division MSBL1 archaeon SCGC-AAA259E19]KXA99029.1 hypothetical protein AKJ41_06095 [candidate division MSBL1 archaeon SCGC-AAA259O05]